MADKKISVKSGKSEDKLASLLGQVMQTREARQFLRTLVPVVFEIWSHKSKVKLWLARMAVPLVGKQLARDDDVFADPELKALFADEKFIRELAGFLPDVISFMIDSLADAGVCFEAAATDTKKELLQSVIGQTGLAQTGEILTSLIRIFNDIHQSDPEFFAKSIVPVFAKWFKSVDFAEIKEFVDGANADVMTLMVQVNEILWQHPSKVVAVAALLPSLVNITAGSLNITFDRLNGLPPDLLIDIVVALLNEIDDDALAEFADQSCEIIRKISVGSALLGEPGLPHLENALNKKIGALVAKIDAKGFWKAKIALSKLKAVIGDAAFEKVNNDPELLRLSILNNTELDNVRLKSKNLQAVFIENLDDIELEELVELKLKALEIGAMADRVNSLISTINHLGEQNPALLSKFAGQFLHAVDVDELSLTADWFFKEIGPELKPVARAFVPGLVEWFCDVLTPDDEEYEDSAQRARKALSLLLTPGEN